MSIADLPQRKRLRARVRRDEAEAHDRLTGGRPKKTRETTPWGIIASYKIELLELREQVRFLTRKMDQLERFVDPRDVAAYRELKLITPTAAEFAAMAQDDGPPPTFVEEPDDAP